MPKPEVRSGFHFHLLSRACPRCGNRGFRPSNVKNKSTVAFSRLGLYPFRCAKCEFLVYSWCLNPGSSQVAPQTVIPETQESETSLTVTRSRSWIQKTALALLASCLGLALLYIVSLARATEERRTAYIAIASVDAIKQALHVMDVANMGFLLTGNSDFREPFNGQRDVLSANFKELLVASADDPTQLEQLRLLKSKLTQWFGLYNPLIIRARSSESNPLATRGLGGQDRETVLRCKLLSEEMLMLLNNIRATQEQKSGLLNTSMN